MRIFRPPIGFGRRRRLRRRDQARVASRLAYATVNRLRRTIPTIIPATRGLPRSLPVEEVLGEVERVAAAGFKEIALTGVHLGSYGRDLARPSSLTELLRRLRDQRSDVLFRISSLEPMDCSREIVDLVADAERFAPHFHLPLQHAADRF